MIYSLNLHSYTGDHTNHRIPHDLQSDGFLSVGIGHAYRRLEVWTRNRFCLPLLSNKTVKRQLPITDCKPSCNRYGSRERNGTWGAVGVGRGGGQHLNFLLEFARFTQVVLPTSGGSGPLEPPGSYAAGIGDDTKATAPSKPKLH